MYRLVKNNKVVAGKYYKSLSVALDIADKSGREVASEYYIITEDKKVFDSWFDITQDEIKKIFNLAVTNIKTANKIKAKKTKKEVRSVVALECVALSRKDGHTIEKTTIKTKEVSSK